MLDRQTIRDARIFGLRQLENFAPSVAVNQLGQVGGTFLTIRGLESNPFIVNRTAIYIDGIPFRTIDNQLLTNASQIEILRGPQGTLYGANADAGLVIVRTADPPYRNMQEASVAYNGFGNGGTVLANVHTAGRLRGLLAGSLTAQYERGDAFVRNAGSSLGLPGSLDHLQLVGKLRTITRSGWRLDGVGLLTRLRAPGVYEQEFVPLDRTAYDRRYAQENAGRRVGRFGLLHDAPKRTQENEGAVGLAATRRFGVGELTVTASHRIEHTDNAGTDLDLLAQPLAAGATASRNRFTNIEARLVSRDSARIGWVIGATAYTERRQQTLATLVGPGGFDEYRPAPPQVSTATDLALFGQLVLPLTASVRLTAGTRLETARRERAQEAGELDLGPTQFQFPADRREGAFGGFVPRLALDWSPNDGWQLYTSVSRGWLPGGFNLEATRADVTSDQARYGAESLWASELGARWRSRSGRFDGAAALYTTTAANWLEYNVLVDSTGAATSTNIIFNAAAVRTRGAELEFRARPIASLLVTTGAGLTDAIYTDYRLVDGRDFSGNRVKLVPRHTLNATATWRPRGGWYLRGELAQRGETMLLPENEARQGTVILLGAQAGYEFPRVTVRAFASNLTDVRAAAGQAYTNFLFGRDGTFYAPLAPPRVIGLSMEWRRGG
ncbi:MAG: TonB-dependent receptor [Gemmatimonadaceae bacterium]|nr:TonB-dependent receptor [Gemmatimonadaceae bacterium]